MGGYSCPPVPHSVSSSPVFRAQWGGGALVKRVTVPPGLPTPEAEYSPREGGWLLSSMLFFSSLLLAIWIAAGAVPLGPLSCAASLISAFQEGNFGIALMVRLMVRFLTLPSFLMKGEAPQTPRRRSPTPSPIAFPGIFWMRVG